MPENPDRYSHGHHESVLRSHRWRTAENSAAFLLPHLRPGMSLLDIGCGPGNITADLAERVGDGPVVGLDLPPDVIATAAADHVRPNLTFRVGDVYALDIADDTFDVAYAHQVLQHLSDPVAALREMRRVVKPGGVVAVRDSDYGAFVWSPADPVLTRWLELYHQLTIRNRAEADAGRYLHTWVRAAGFDDFQLSHSAWTFQSEADRTWWGGVWADRALHSEFARQCLEEGLCDQAELQQISDAFRRWAAEPEGLFVLLHGEVIARK
jgi:ubiquinone/menaquinone biosynthesis C-methylase UbiE